MKKFKNLREAHKAARTLAIDYYYQAKDSVPVYVLRPDGDTDVFRIIIKSRLELVVRKSKVGGWITLGNRVEKSDTPCIV